DLGTIARDLLQPPANRAGPLHEAVDVGDGPARLLIDDRAGVVEDRLELASIQMSHDAAQDDVPGRVAPHLTAHDHHPDAMARMGLARRGPGGFGLGAGVSRHWRPRAGWAAPASSRGAGD